MELETLVLNEPDGDGKCQTEFLQVTGGIGNSKIPKLCGTNNGQHLIYSATPNFPAMVSIVINTGLTTTVNRDWTIKILQLGCDTIYTAPEGCLQYYTAIAGVVSSFNWKGATVDSSTTDAPNHLADLDYNICIRTMSGYCKIEWSTPTPVEDQIGYFSLSENLPTTDALAPATDVKNGDASCTTDYLSIPRGGGGVDVQLADSKDRFCGQALGYFGKKTSSDPAPDEVIGPVSSGSIPFILGVYTDSDEGNPAETNNRGFLLNYRQQACTSSG